MEEWLRFSVAYWHSFRGTGSDPFGAGTIRRPWDDGTESLENAKRRLRAAFEFFSKLGNKYWTFHDRDLAPEGATIAETNANLDQLVELAAELQKKTGVKLLWATCNLFAHPRYMHGAATSCDAHVTAYAGAQVKKGLEIAHRLGAENFVFWGGREGYLSLLNTDVKADLDHLAAFFRMVVGINRYGMLGSIDANTGSPDLGWDTDQFPMDVRNCTVIMKAVVEQAGLAPGGLNFDAKVRRESTELRDLFIAHAAAMDTFARGLKNAARIISDGVMRKSLMARYASWNSGVGARIAAGEASLEECEKVILERGDPKPSSGHQEHFEAMLNHYI
ncbi:xylose isomerase-like [Penaeus monodon]|uniref:xylose isomerase-like n=1 Tax=Penaeus monodon TaxID=6687 RepID=UPI0018A79909|nr:xylose isomerase-like [Penaeus monodon]